MISWVSKCYFAVFSAIMCYGAYTHSLVIALWFGGSAILALYVS